MRTQNEIVQFLNSLEHNRFNIETLTKTLSDFFNTEIEIENVSEINDDDDCVDWNLMFNIEDGTEQSGFYDIYILKMRRPGFDGATMFVTEVGFEFI